MQPQEMFRPPTLYVLTTGRSVTAWLPYLRRRFARYGFHLNFFGCGLYLYRHRRNGFVAAFPSTHGDRTETDPNIPSGVRKFIAGLSVADRHIRGKNVPPLCKIPSQTDRFAQTEEYRRSTSGSKFRRPSKERVLAPRYGTESCNRLISLFRACRTALSPERHMSDRSTIGYARIYRKANRPKRGDGHLAISAAGSDIYRRFYLGRDIASRSFFIFCSLFNTVRFLSVAA